MSLVFKPIGELSLSAAEFMDLNKVSNAFPHEGKVLFVLDGAIDGFRAAYIKSDEYVGIAVLLPKQTGPQSTERTLARLYQNAKLIFQLVLNRSGLEKRDKTKVILLLANRRGYFRGKLEQNLTADLTKALNESVHEDRGPGYTGTTSEEGMYLFELPYMTTTMQMDTCGQYVKVDLNHPDMQSAEAVAFFKRLANDLTLCRGQSHLYKVFEPSPNKVLYLMFRNRVPDSEWWKDLRNVSYVCAASMAIIYHESGSMYLAAICSRPGTTGAVADMLKRISADAKNTYHLNQLLLVPANTNLANIYQRPAYGFAMNVENKRYMVKYLTETGPAEARKRAAAAAAVSNANTFDFDVVPLTKLLDEPSAAAASEPLLDSLVADLETFAPKQHSTYMYPRSTTTAPGYSAWQEEGRPHPGKDVSLWGSEPLFDDSLGIDLDDFAPTRRREKEHDGESLQKRPRTEGTGGKKKTSRKQRGRQARSRSSRRYV
jgi:hypothetical protein